MLSDCLGLSPSPSPEESASITKAEERSPSERFMYAIRDGLRKATLLTYKDLSRISLLLVSSSMQSTGEHASDHTVTMP